MKIVVVGGTSASPRGPVARSHRVEGGAGVDRTRHEAVAAAPSTGVNTVTGEGLADALAGATVVVDVSNSPSFEDAPAKEFFQKATSNLLKAEADTGVTHYVALSVVGTGMLAKQSGYFEAKLNQQRLVAAGPIPYTIVQVTQFFEFLGTIADSATEGDTVTLRPALIQPMASADVAEAVARAAVGDPVNGITEVGGPQQFRLPDLIQTVLTADGDARNVVSDPAAQYWGIDIDERTLIPGEGATLYETRLDDWIVEASAKPWQITEIRASACGYSYTRACVMAGCPVRHRSGQVAR